MAEHQFLADLRLTKNVLKDARIHPEPALTDVGIGLLHFETGAAPVFTPGLATPVGSILGGGHLAVNEGTAWHRLARVQANENIYGFWNFYPQQVGDLRPFTIDSSRTQMVNTLNVEFLQSKIPSVDRTPDTIGLRYKETGVGDDTQGRLKVGTPIHAHDAVTKEYADNLALGIRQLDACVCSTTADLPANYTTTDDGTLTQTAPFSPITDTAQRANFDGVDASKLIIDARILVRQQGPGTDPGGTSGTASPEGGIYLLKVIGVAGTTPWKLVRAEDADQVTEIDVGANVFVTDGVQFAKSSFTQQLNLVSSLHTENNKWALFTQAGNFTEGRGIKFEGPKINFAQALDYTTGAVPYATGATTIGFVPPATLTNRFLLYDTTTSKPIWAQVPFTAITGVPGTNITATQGITITPAGSVPLDTARVVQLSGGPFSSLRYLHWDATLAGGSGSVGGFVEGAISQFSSGTVTANVTVNATLKIKSTSFPATPYALAGFFVNPNSAATDLVNYAANHVRTFLGYTGGPGITVDNTAGTVRFKGTPFSPNGNGHLFSWKGPPDDQLQHIALRFDTTGTPTLIPENTDTTHAPVNLGTATRWFGAQFFYAGTDIPTAGNTTRILTFNDSTGLYQVINRPLSRLAAELGASGLFAKHAVVDATFSTAGETKQIQHNLQVESRNLTVTVWDITVPGSYKTVQAEVSGSNDTDMINVGVGPMPSGITARTLRVVVVGRQI